MTDADAYDPADDDLDAASGIAKGQKALNEAVAKAQAKISEHAKTAQDALRKHADSLNEYTKGYRDTAGERFDDAQRYVVDAVNERPLVAVLIGFAVGLVFGVLLSSRSKRSS
jgi:ElaB/YqjD/DUF883 family membrane-anchored ribosome-binding protein